MVSRALTWKVVVVDKLAVQQRGISHFTRADLEHQSKWLPVQTIPELRPAMATQPGDAFSRQLVHAHMI
jgi:hypothetical protein